MADSLLLAPQTGLVLAERAGGDLLAVLDRGRVFASLGAWQWQPLLLALHPRDPQRGQAGHVTAAWLLTE